MKGMKSLKLSWVRRLFITVALVGCYALIAPDKVIAPVEASSAIRGAAHGIKEDLQRLTGDEEREERERKQREKIEELEKKLKEMEEKQKGPDNPQGASSGTVPGGKKLVDIKLTVNIPTTRSGGRTSARNVKGWMPAPEALTAVPTNGRQEAVPSVPGEVRSYEADIRGVNIIDAVRRYDCYIVENTMNRFDGNCLITLENDDQYSVGYRLENLGGGKFRVQYNDVMLAEYAAALLALGMDNTSELITEYRANPALFTLSAIYDTRNAVEAAKLQSIIATSLAMFE